MLRSGKFISSLCADENGLFIFLGRKKETNLANWSEVNRIWTAFFEGESGFRGQQHHSVGITTGLDCMLSGLIYY